MVRFVASVSGGRLPVVVVVYSVLSVRQCEIDIGERLSWKHH